MRLRLLPLSAACLIACAGIALSAPTKITKKKIFLTRINATSAVGLCLHLSGNVLALDNLSGDRATAFAIAPSTLSMRPSVQVKYEIKNRKRLYEWAKQSWKLTDATGEGVDILDNSLQTLVIVSRVDHSVSFISAGAVYPVPGHSFVLVNDPPRGSVLDYGSTGWLGFTGHYREKMWPIVQPTEVIISPNDNGITNGFPSITEDTHCDESISLSGK
jgi:hypothetical protein